MIAAMNLIATLLSLPRTFVGDGINHEGEAFVGRLRIEPLVNGTALMLRYTATGIDGRPLHEEATLLGANEGGDLCLWPVMAELPLVLPHREAGRTLLGNGGLTVVFASGPRDALEAFREEITIAITPNAGSLGYAHAWGMPGGAFEARSRCELIAVR